MAATTTTSSLIASNRIDNDWYRGVDIVASHWKLFVQMKTQPNSSMDVSVFVFCFKTRNPVPLLSFTNYISSLLALHCKWLSLLFKFA
jgi:hypothetical protein